MQVPQIGDEAFTTAALKRDRRRFENALFLSALAVGFLWLMYLAEWISGAQFAWAGLAPREAMGLVGIVTAPLVHGSLGHLVANSLPTFILLSLGLYAVPRATFRALPWIWLISGALVWIFARSSLHIGASGVTHGLMSFLLLLGILRRDRQMMVIAGVVAFLFGSMIYGFLPTEPGISFEYHGGGLLAGVVLAILTRNQDAKLPERRYSWEDETEDSFETATIGDPLEPPSPETVSPIWQGPTVSRGQIIVFPQARTRSPQGEESDSRS